MCTCVYLGETLWLCYISFRVVLKEARCFWEQDYDDDDAPFVLWTDLVDKTQQTQHAFVTVRKYFLLVLLTSHSLTVYFPYLRTQHSFCPESKFCCMGTTKLNWNCMD